MTSQPTPEAVEAVALELMAARFGAKPAVAHSVDRLDARRVLAFIRDAIHRDGDDADAIRQALGLEWDEEIKPKGNGIAHFARVVSGWQEVPDGYGE